MMKMNLRRWTLAGLVVCSSGLNGFAADGVVYQFDNWKVTITPGPSAARAARSPSKTDIVPAPKAFGDKTAPSRPRIEVLPVSLRQDVPAAQPAPMPDVAVPALKAAAEPKPILPPVPERASVLEQPIPPLSDQIPMPSDCCAEPIITPRMADVGATAMPLIPQTAMYRDIYYSIPFNRAEYNAYPSYRHDATMEFLFNQMRPTTIQRGTTNVYSYGMGYGGYGPGYNYAYGPGYGYGPGFPQQYYPYNYGLRIHSSR